jgi:phosphoenolpyruvate phosphomutase
MQECAFKIKEQENLTEVEDDIASVKEIFRLQGAQELAEAERQYFLGARKGTKAIILAASRGQGLDELTKDRPKAMIPVNGKPLLSRLVERCKRQGVDAVTIVGGYKADTIPTEKIDLIVNHEYATSGELSSLLTASSGFCDDMVVIYGDLVFRGYVLRSLLESDREMTIVVDSQSKSDEGSGVADLAYCSAPDDRTLWGQDILLEHLSTDNTLNEKQADGRWIGMLRVKGIGREWLKNALKKLKEKQNFNELSLRHLINQILSDGNPIRVIYIHGHWIDVNSIADLDKASALAGTNHK